MSGGRYAREKDRLRDRSDVGEVEFLMDKLLTFRDAGVCCVHVEALLEADRGLTDMGKKRPK
ncbi:MAG: hypothetical protein QF893_23605 [Alphaproteobacteria bacterium]|jgi:hypothetical protein|nr:hypothetical protein [Alphaproteobacteria bacterium]